MKFLVLVTLSLASLAAASAMDSSKTKNTAAADGYPVEEHFVYTADGYILKVFRIPGSASSPAAQGKTVVFLQHGLLCSSADWLVLGPQKAIAYLLADAGYDVWLGNARGNTNSRQHQWLSTSSSSFWDFSWHQIGLVDLPAMIDFALSYTGQKDLHYIGHSQGTTSFFVMGSLRQDMNAKIRTMHAFAPVAFMGNLVSPMLRIMAPMVDSIETMLTMFGVYEFLPSNDLLTKGGSLICKDESPFQEICANALFLLGGFNSAQLNRTILPEIIANTPAGSSVDQLVHYAHGINSKRFARYDYGLTKNLFTYGSFIPPSYDLGAITAPVYLHYSENDWMAAEKDVDELASKLGNLAGKLKISDTKFNHLDFTYATDADTLLYNTVLDIIKAN